MRAFNIAALFLICLPLVGQQNKSQTREQKSERTANNGHPQTSDTVVEIHKGSQVGTPTSESKQQAAQTEAKPFLTHGEWVMAILTAVYVIISYFVLQAIKREARIGQQAADAATKSADALMNAERAWLLARTVDVDSRTKEILTGRIREAVRPREQGVTIRFEYCFTNLGRTPARITRIGARFQKLQTLADLPAEPNYGIAVLDVQLVLAPNDSTNLTWQVLEPDGVLTGDEVVSITLGKAFLYAYGFVKYLDIFDRQQEARFGYVWHMPETFDTYFGFRIAGPPAYGHQT